MKKTPWPVAKPFLGEAEIEAVAKVLRSGWVTQGPEVEALEKEFAEFVGAPEAIAVSNCSVGLFLGLRALGIGPGQEVIVPSHSFIATANAVVHCGATPVFVDIRPDYNLDPNQVESAITERTSAILAVHQLGMPCDLKALTDIADHHGIDLVEDAACAAGSEFQGQRIGRPHGRWACFSFHPRKMITTGDGGMLTTSDSELARRFRLLRHQGMSVSDRDRHSAADVVFEEYVEVGFNFRLTDIQAALGRVQLGRLESLLKNRRKQVSFYRDRLGELLQFPDEPQGVKSNWQSLCVRLPRGTDQKRVMQVLWSQGIQTRRGVHCAHLEPAFAQVDWRCYRGCRGECPHLKESVRAHREGLILPLFEGLTEENQWTICEALIEALTPQRRSAPLSTAR